ncbi:MAG: hypothetical protein NC433_04895 [Clostridiales bacterium]|nr:hypothetical protein [Clostridiales bacterium]
MYQFIPRQEMQSVLDIADFQEDNRAEIAYQSFVNDNQEAMYIEKDGILLGVVSIGDLERYYGNGKDKLEINSHFSYADKIDEEKAETFFSRLKTFFEFPVVNDCGRLEGVMTRDMRYDIRKDQIASLVVSRYLKEQWHKHELNRFVTNTKARVVLYYTEESVIMNEIAGRKRNGICTDEEEIFWKGLSEKQWDEFLGESGVVMNLKKEFGNFHTHRIKGVSGFVDIKGEFYNSVDGNRITIGNPEMPDSHIVFYGPCTIAGAYGKDGETIESYLQRMVNMRAETQIQVINKGLFNMENFFSRMMTDKLCEKDIAVIYVDKRWLSEEITGKCAYVGNLTDTFLQVENLENCILDVPDHCNYKVNQHLAERIYHDLEEHKLFDTTGLSDKAEQIQDYYIGSEIMSEVLLYMERNDLIKEDASTITGGAITLLADPFTDRHRLAVEAALQKVDKLYLFISEDSNLKYTLEERIQMVKESLQDLEDRVVVVPAGKYLYTKKITRGIRKQRFCDDDMEYDCDIFGEIYGRFMGIKYRFIIKELDNPVEQKYMNLCISILHQFGITVTNIEKEIMC